MAISSDTLPSRSWSALEDLSQQIYRAADDENWPYVLELASRRHEHLMEHFAQFPVGPDNAEFYHNHLHTLLTSEQRLQSMTIEARKAVMRDGLISSRNHRAIDSYLKQ